MIDEELTNAAFGYYSWELKPHSCKPIFAACDDCGKVRETSKDKYHALCSSCAQKGENNPNFGSTRSEETKAKISAAQSGKYIGENNPNWLGGISFAPYCIKFNDEYKDYIRNFFGNVCFLCGMTTEVNGQLLSVHHKDYNKQCGCDGTKCFCVPLCKRCHSKTNGDRDFWQCLITEMLQPAEAWE